MDGTQRTQWIDSLDARIQTAAADVVAETYGATVCQLHKDGRVSGGLKYAEGRLVALRQLRNRLLQADGDASEIQAAERANWQQLLDSHAAKERPALPWLAYSQGGLDALAAPLPSPPGPLSHEDVGEGE